MKILDGVDVSTLGATYSTQIEKPIHALSFRINQNGVSYDEATALKLACIGLLITLSYVDKAGNPIYIYRKKPLNEVLELSAIGHGEGSHALTVRNGEISELLGTLDITFSNGSIPLDDDQYLQLELTGFTGSHRLSIYGIESPTRTNHVIQLNTFNVPRGNEQKVFQIENLEYLAIPIASAAKIDYLRFMSGGRSTQVSMDELQALQYRNNDSILSISGIASKAYESMYLVRSKYVLPSTDVEVQMRDSNDDVQIYGLQLKVLKKIDAAKLEDGNNQIWE